MRSSAIELQALPREDSARARRRARRQRAVRAHCRAARRRARDDRRQPAVHRGDGADAARIGRPAERHPAHRAGDDLGPDRPAARAPRRPCCGAPRSPDATFWSGAVDALGDSPVEGGELWTTSSQRDFLVREPRSTIRGEEAYRFKHVLIRDVAYAGLSKSSRALLHRQMARLARGPPGRRRARRDPRLPPRRGRPAHEPSSRGACRPSSPPMRLRRSSRRVAGACARGERFARRLLVARRRARADARAPVPGRPGRLAVDRHPDRLGRDARRQRGSTRAG